TPTRPVLVDRDAPLCALRAAGNTDANGLNGRKRKLQKFFLEQTLGTQLVADRGRSQSISPFGSVQSVCVRIPRGSQQVTPTVPARRTTPPRESRDQGPNQPTSSVRANAW